MFVEHPRMLQKSHPLSRPCRISRGCGHEAHGHERRAVLGAIPGLYSGAGPACVGVPRHGLVRPRLGRRPGDRSPCARRDEDGQRSPRLVEQANGKPGSRPGDLWIVLAGPDEPVCIIETTKVRVIHYDKVPEGYAWEGGEGDRSLGQWRRIYWERTCPSASA